MARVRISREEIDLIVKAADRIAKRMHARFVVDHDKVEIVEDKPPKDADQPQYLGIDHTAGSDSR